MQMLFTKADQQMVLNDQKDRDAAFREIGKYIGIKLAVR